MKSLKQLIVMLALVIAGGFVYHSEVKAQTVKQTKSETLEAIKDKRKVYVFAQSNESQNKIEQVVRTSSNLEIADKPEDAEFFIKELVEVRSSTETPPNLKYKLGRLQIPEQPQNQAQKSATNDADNPMKVRNVMVKKTTIQVYFVKDDGTKVIVWSKDSSSKISSAPQTTKPINASTDTAPEVSRYYTPKDDAGELTKSFVKKLKTGNSMK